MAYATLAPSQTNHCGVLTAAEIATDSKNRARQTPLPDDSAKDSSDGVALGNGRDGVAQADLGLLAVFVPSLVAGAGSGVDARDGLRDVAGVKPASAWREYQACMGKYQACMEP